MYERTPELFMGFRKHCRYHICFEEARVGKDFENGMCCAFGLHFCFWKKTITVRLSKNIIILSGNPALNFKSGEEGTLCHVYIQLSRL